MDLPRILIIGSENELRALKLFDAKRAEPFRCCQPIYAGFVDAKNGNTTFKTLNDVARYASDPVKGIKGILMGAKRQDTGELYSTDLCKLLKQSGFNGPIAVQARESDQRMTQLDMEAQEAGALGMFDSNKTHKNSRQSALAELNKAIAGTNKKISGALLK